MTDATPCAAPTPAQPSATVTSPEAPFPPPAPLPHAVGPAVPVTDPVSNLDFLPVDDAFALEMRSESIEQLVGGDALRRGESERIEAGRSHTNADLVAGRDRVRVHGTLHEHTGHALAEQAAHLHTTVDGRLDVHAGSEDTVLLAGHMSDLWDGSAAIVAAMTDDTAAGGGIRVTTPLDLWVHGLMGVEERIGTCTADAVLMESGATHYEREYGPGAHAAGLAVYTGSLYQSSRSTFRPLMRVSSGVRNLIAGGDGGGAGGDAGAGDAPVASPPPVPAEPGAAAQSASATLAAGRGAAETPATALDTADALTDARRAPLEELVDSVDARGAEEVREAGTVMRTGDLPELTRSADTAERLGALQETLCIDKVASGREGAGGFRASEVVGAVSMHPTTGGGGPLEIEPHSAVHFEYAPIARPHPGVPWGQGPEMRLVLLGGADRPPRSAAPKSDFHAVYSKMRELHKLFRRNSARDIAREFKSAIDRVSGLTLRKFERLGGNARKLTLRPSGITIADQAYAALQEFARQAAIDGDVDRADAIRMALDGINVRAGAELQALRTKYEIAEARSTLAMRRPPATTGPTVTVAATPRPAHTSIQSDWIPAYRQLRSLNRDCLAIGWNRAHLDFNAAADRMEQTVWYKFRQVSRNHEYRSSFSGGATKPEQAYRAIEDMARRAAESGDAVRIGDPRKTLESVNRFMSEELNALTRKYGALEALSTRAAQTMQAAQAVQPPLVRVGPTTSATPPVTVVSTTVPPTGRLELLAPAHPIVPEATHAFPEPAGGLIQTTGVPGPPPASSLPGPSLSEAGGAQAGDLGRWWLDPPAIGTTAAEPVATEAIVTPLLAEMTSFWLQPANPVLATGSVSVDPGLHHAGETVQPPPVTTAPTSTAPALSPGAPFPAPSRADDDYADSPALPAGEFPPRFDASRLIVEAGTPEQFGLADDPAAGRISIPTVNALIEGYRATDEGGRNAPQIEYLRSLKESIERAQLDGYSGRVGTGWLDQVRDLEPPRRRGELAAPSAASATRLPEFDVNEIDRLLGTGERVPHPAPRPPPLAPGRAGAGAPPPAADRWGIRPAGMSGEPHPAPRPPPLAPGRAGAGAPPPAADRWGIRPAGMSGEPHPAPHPPPLAPGRAGAGAPPPAADRWGIRPAGMSGEPHPAAFDPWSTPPGPSSQVVYTEAMRTPVLSTGAPPGWLGAGTPGFARAASRAVELPFWRREEIALRFRTEDALLEAELALQTGGARTLGWSATRWRRVRADLYRLNTILQSNSAAAAAMVDVDWSAIEALARILQVSPPSP